MNKGRRSSIGEKGRRKSSIDGLAVVSPKAKKKKRNTWAVEPGSSSGVSDNNWTDARLGTEPRMEDPNSKDSGDIENVE